MFTLKLSTEEIKTLQTALEEAIARLPDDRFHGPSLERDTLAKITLAQLEDEEPKKDTGRISFQCVPIF